MNITVHVPAALQSRVEGRASLSLGLPAKASVADLLEALLLLYPGLRACLLTERTVGRGALSLFLPEAGGGRLKEGSAVCLVGLEAGR